MTEQKRPNILFIMTDEQRYDTFSHVNPKIKTPCLDQLIRDSVFFKNAYCSNPSCIPSRAAIMTGKFPTQCQVPTYITYLPEDEYTFMNRLRDVGYHTAVVGKQHFADTNIDKGYDEEWIIDGHSPTAEEAQIYKSYIKGLGLEGKTHCDGSLIIGGEWQWDTDHHIDSFVAELGKDWLDKQKNGDEDQDKPWFFTLSFPGPHQPYDLEGTKYAEDYKLEDMDLAETTEADLANKPPHFMELNPKAYCSKYPEETFRKTKRSYYANMSLIDEKVGEVVEILKRKGLYDNTMIVYTADHGDFMGDFDMVSKAQYLTEGLMRVPLFVKPPIAGFKGYDTEDKVLNIDLAATCLDVAEGNLGYQMSDYSWTDYWRKEEPRKRDYIFMEAGGMKSIIKDGIKLVHYQGRSYGELYDLDKDPVEKYNLWDDPDYQTYKHGHRMLIIDQMIEMAPKSEIPWNVNAPII